MVSRGQSRENVEKARISSKSRSRGKKCKAKCCYCNKIGHLKKDYWKRKESFENPKKEANQVESCMIDKVLFVETRMIYEALSNCNVSHHLEYWLLDFGASHHMSLHKN